MFLVTLAVRFLVQAKYFAIWSNLQYFKWDSGFGHLSLATRQDLKKTIIDKDQFIYPFIICFTLKFSQNENHIGTEIAQSSSANMLTRWRVKVTNNTINLLVFMYSVQNIYHKHCLGRHALYSQLTRISWQTLRQLPTKNTLKWSK